MHGTKNIKFILRIKEQKTRLILHEHDDDGGYKKQRGVQNSLFSRLAAQNTGTKITPYFFIKI
jgi:hypothetical protein